MAGKILINHVNEIAIKIEGMETKIGDIIRDIDSELINDKEITSKITELLSHDKKVIKPYLRAYKIGQDDLSLLHFAAKNYRQKLCEYLIDVINIDVNRRSKRLRTPLHMLIKFHSVDKEVELLNTFNLLVFKKADCNAKDENGMTVLHKAIFTRKTSLLLKLIKTSKITLTIEDNHGFTPLHIAIKENLDEVALLLIDRIEPEKLISSSIETLSIHSALELKEEKFDIVLKLLEKIYSKKQIYLTYTLLYKLNSHKHSILQLAIENNHINVTDLIIKRFYPDYNKPDANGNLPTHLTADSGNVAILNILIKYNAVSFSSNSNNQNPLHIAALKNRFAFIIEFLKIESAFIEEQKELGIEVTPCIRQLNDRNQTPLFSAVTMGNIKCVEALLSSTDIKYDTTDIEGNSIIHLCAKINNVEALIFLLKTSHFLVNLFNENESNELPLHIAAKHGNIDIFKLIIQKFYDGTFESKESYLTSKDKEGRNCFHLACMHGFSNIVEYLIKDLKLTFLIDTMDNEHNTGLHFASAHSFLSIVELLLSCSLDYNAKNRNNETALMLSCFNKHFDISKAIINKYETIESSKDEMRLLHTAAEHGAYELVSLLLEKGVFIDYLNNEGANALDIAINFNQKEVIRVLLTDANWKKLIETEPKRPKVKKSMIAFDLLEILNTSKTHEKTYRGENPQLYHLFEKKMWDMYLIILNNSVDQTDLAFDFTILDPSIDSVRKHPLMLIARSGQETLLTHAVTQKLLYLKWRSIPRLTFYSYLLLYIFFLIIFGLYSMEITEISVANSKLGKNSNVDRIWDNYKTIYHYPIIFLMILVICKITIQIVLIDGFSYLTSIVNWFETMSLAFTCVSLFSKKLAVKSQYSSLAILCLFASFMFLIQKLKVFGVYVLAFRRTLLNSAKFLPVFLIAYIGFILAFRVRVDTNLKYFNSTTSTSFLNGITMMMGDFQTNKMGVSDSIINYFLYVTFICVMSVIILNLFVGIAVGEIKQTLDEADIQQISMRIVYLLKIQDALKFTKKNAYLNKIFNMSFTHYSYTRNENILIQTIHKYSNYINSKLKSDNPEINLVDPQTRLEDSIFELSTNTQGNFKQVREALQYQMIEVNDKLNKSKQRLEDCLTEMSRKTVANFESTAEDSSTALLNVESNLIRSQNQILNNLKSLDRLANLKFKASKESIIEHIKTSDRLGLKHHNSVMEKLNFMLNSELLRIKEDSRFVKESTQSEFKGINDMLHLINDKINGFETNINAISRQLCDVQVQLSSKSPQTRPKSLELAEEHTKKNKMTPYIKSFKSKLETPVDESVRQGAATSESESRPRTSRDTEFLSKLSRFGGTSPKNRPPKK